MAIGVEPRADAAPVRLRVERAASRNRLTIFFRSLLALPQFVVVTVLLFAGGIVAIPAWLAALATGRNPAPMRHFLADVIGWSTRLQCYLSLVTDAYPPWSGEVVGHPVDLELPPAGPLNRLAVLGRIVLILPAYLVSVVINAGLAPFVVFAWFAGVFAGRIPRAVTDALATTCRYQARLLAYGWLVTATYPWGPMGDGLDRTAAPPYFPPPYGYEPVRPPWYGPPPPAYGYPPPDHGYPPPPPPGYGYPPPPPGVGYPPPTAEAPETPPAPGYGNPPPNPGYGYPPPPGYGYPSPPPQPAAVAVAADPHRYTGLVTNGGRAILIIAAVLGALQYADYGIGFATGRANFGNPFQTIDLLNEGNRFDAALDNSTCPADGTDCTSAVSARLLTAAKRLDKYAHGRGAAAQRARLGTDLAAFEAEVRRATTANRLVDGSGEIVDTQLLEDQTRIDHDVTSLEHALG